MSYMVKDGEIIATAEFQGETLEELTKRAIEAFWKYVGEPEAGEFNKRYRVVVGISTPGDGYEQRNGRGDVLVSISPWKAECHLVAREATS